MQRALGVVEAGVPARDDQADARKRQAVAFQARCVNVPLDVVDADERHAADPGQGLGGRQAQEKRPDDPRPIDDRHGVDGAGGPPPPTPIRWTFAWM